MDPPLIVGSALSLIDSGATSYSGLPSNYSTWSEYCFVLNYKECNC